MGPQFGHGSYRIDKLRETQQRILDAKRREDLLARIDRLTELPLLVLAFVMVPLLVGPLLWDLSPGEEATFIALDTFIWAAFTADLVVKTIVAPRRWPFLRRHWIEVLIVAVPFFSPLRLLRLVLYGSHAFSGARRLVHVDFLLVYGLGLVLIVSTIVTTVERDAEGSSIRSFPDALWWSLVTMSTVGYGDMVPVTATGKVMAVFLMLGGIAFFAGMAGNIVSSIGRRDDHREGKIAELTSEVKGLREEIESLRQGWEHSPAQMNSSGDAGCPKPVDERGRTDEDSSGP